MKRRDFLKLSAAAGAAALMPPALAAESPSAYRDALVLVELKGGNDGLNTVVPFADPRYRELRPRIGIARDQAIPLDERTGLHPSLEALVPLWRAGELAIVQGVGYPDPNLSHFRSIEIWDTASSSHQYLSEGWLARALRVRPIPEDFAAAGAVIGSEELGPFAGADDVLVLDRPEQLLRGARLAVPAGASGNAALEHVLEVENEIVQAAKRLRVDTALRTEFPAGPFGAAARTAAQVIASASPVAAVRITLSGFDTHQNQPGVQASLLKQFAEGVAALKAALVETGRWNSTLVMTYAEFGRRAAENASNGTDHGTASAHFVLGGRVRGGLFGAAPQLDRLESGNLVAAVDFRSLYATVLERWWGIASSAVLGARFAPLDLIKA